MNLKEEYLPQWQAKIPMIHRIGKKKYRIYGFDLESHNDDESIAKQETSMWLGCFIDETNKVDEERSYVYDMASFIERLKKEVNPTRKHGENRPIKNICVYVYNFSFEWSFIFPYIHEMCSFKSKITDDDEYVFNSVSTKTCSSVWQAQVKFNKEGGIVVFRDLAKIYGGGLAKVAKAFGLPTQKGEIDYRMNRLHGYIPTAADKEYCFKDTRIIIDILQKIIEKSDKDFFNAVSMASYAMRKMIKYGWPKTCKPMKEFRKNYPIIPEESDEAKFLRQSVGGGICYPTRTWQYKVVHKRILHIDAHQMHPSQCYTKLFPYGNGEYFTGKPPFDRICCCRIRITYDDVKLHSIIKLIPYDFVENHEIVVWDFEIPTMYKAYVNLEIEYIDGYAYKMRPLPWRRFYLDNYKERLKARAINDTFNVLYYKLLNNSSYGKLLERPHMDMFVNTINEDGIIDSEIMQREDAGEIAKYTYLPVGSAIPAYSRVNLIEKALLFGYEKVLYLDTDSIFVIYDQETDQIWRDKFNHLDMLGGWASEEIIDKAQFTAPKRYKTEVDGKASIKAAGINFNQFKVDKVNELLTNEARIVSEEDKKEMVQKYQIPFDEVNIVSSEWKVQRAFRCKGGTLIIFQTKKMEVQKKYESIYKLNTNDIM